MCHTGTSDSLNESLLNDSLFHIQSQLTCTLLGSTPAYTVCQTGNIFYFFCLNPFCFFRDWSTAMMHTLCYSTHFFNFF